MTSNLLAQILLVENWGVQPQVQAESPDLGEMLARHDACVLIGDIGMLADGAGLYDLDLGEAWTALTGLPFVWAMWLGHDGVTPELAACLAGALDASGLGADRDGPTNEDFLAWAVKESGWEQSTARSYLLETMHFRLDDPAQAGLERFSSLAMSLGLLEGLSMPEVISGEGS
jgi:chorismate dehydratase